jgi:hypothetical protein
VVDASVNKYSTWRDKFEDTAPDVFVSPSGFLNMAVTDKKETGEHHAL